MRLAAACLAVAAQAVAAAPALEVEPASVLEGQRVVVRMTGLAPGEAVTLHLVRVHERYPAGQEAFRGRAVFVAGPDGTVDSATSAPLAGSDYAGIDPAGAFWSMVPVRREPKRAEEALRLDLADAAALAPGEVALDLEQRGRVVARARAMLAIRTPGVTVREVRAPGVVGVHAQAASGSSPRPAVLVLGGSEGGLFTARSIAPLLASRGYAVLGVGYFRRGEEGLETLPAALEDVPLERLEAARRWLLAQPGVVPDRLAIVGVSKGAEMALLAAAHFPWVDAAAAFAPSHVVWEGIPGVGAVVAARSSWTLGGRPLPFVPWSAAAEQRGDRTRRTTGSSRLTEVHLESLAEAGTARIDAARIPVERGRAAILLVAGLDDARWPAAYAAAQIAKRMAAAGQDARLQVLDAATGHLVLGTGWAPTTSFQRSTGALQGGSPALDAVAQARSWAALLAFLESSIGRGGS